LGVQLLIWIGRYVYYELVVNSTLNTLQPWLLLILSLSGPQGASRMRIWRALKGSGAAVLRDGVYLLPARPEHRQSLQAQADAVRAAGGCAYLIAFESQSEQTGVLQALFDRGADYAGLLASVQSFRDAVEQIEEVEARRQLAQLQRQFQVITAIDYFPGPPRGQSAQAIAEAEAAFNRRFSPDEPRAVQGAIAQRERAEYRAQVWVTRAHLWVDRVASAWLIRRFIDPDARFVWLPDVKACPEDAVGFDFDGAEFTHVGERVTFEVLLQSFSLADDPALRRLAALVHFLDVGGLPVPEAAGFAAILTGVRARVPDDDAFLAEASGLLDDLYLGYTQPPKAGASKAVPPAAL
jgi:hypothetical protein